LNKCLEELDIKGAIVSANAITLLVKIRIKNLSCKILVLCLN